MSMYPKNRPQGVRVGAGGRHGAAAVEGEERMTVAPAPDDTEAATTHGGVT
jgi:hypothetical protein